MPRRCRRTSPLLAVVAILGGTPAARAADPPPSPRAQLVPPDDLWDTVLGGLGRAGGRVGYDRERMGDYGRDAYRLRLLDELFRDARNAPRMGGRLADELLGDGDNLAEVVRRGYLLTDISAGRMLPVPDEPWLGVEWIPKDASPDRALAAVLAWRPAGAAATPLPLDDRKRAAWATLPEPVQRLVLRLFVAAAEARPWLLAAFDPAFLAGATGSAIGTEPDRGKLYRLAIAPFDDERAEQSATLSRASFEALDRIDRSYLAFGSVLELAYAGKALADFAASSGARGLPAGFPGLTLLTALGPVRISGPGPDALAEPVFLSLDLGGDDSYRGAQATPLALGSPSALLVDLAGDDTYDAGDARPGLACGLFGLGALVDLAGNDSYRILESGLGAGWHGTGVLLDRAGADRYITGQRWGAGVGHAGVGALVDLDGDDYHECAEQSQGLGSTLGAGLLVDHHGNDRYIARDDGNVEAIYLGQSVAMAQGAGLGRRADLGDGHSLAGGVGLLVDGDGDDLYHAQVWAQGAGYWWSAGFLEDLAGDDLYENGKYSLGAAAHFAIGSQVDLAGDDRYNVGNRTAVNQFQGHARDGSIGVSFDGGGDDQYLLKSHSGGSGDLGAIGLFWDRSGADCYELSPEPLGDNPGWTGTPPLGSATVYGPFRSFRDELDALGVFLDTGGRDDYRGDGTSRDDARWLRRRNPRSLGFGLDAEWVAPPGP